MCNSGSVSFLSSFLHITWVEFLVIKLRVFSFAFIVSKKIVIISWRLDLLVFMPVVYIFLVFHRPLSWVQVFLENVESFHTLECKLSSSSTKVFFNTKFVTLRNLEVAVKDGDKRSNIIEKYLKRHFHVVVVIVKASMHFHRIRPP